MNHVALVALGALAGSVGTKVLTSAPAKKVYVKGVVAGMCVRDGVASVIEEAKAQFDDICAEAEYEMQQNENKDECECESSSNQASHARKNKDNKDKKDKKNSKNDVFSSDDTLPF